MKNWFLVKRCKEVKILSKDVKSKGRNRPWNSRLNAEVNDADDEEKKDELKGGIHQLYIEVFSAKEPKTVIDICVYTAKQGFYYECALRDSFSATSASICGKVRLVRDKFLRAVCRSMQQHLHKQLVPSKQHQQTFFRNDLLLPAALASLQSSPNRHANKKERSFRAPALRRRVCSLARSWGQTKAQSDVLSLCSLARV